MDFDYDSWNRRSKETSATHSREELEGRRLTAPPELFNHMGDEVSMTLRYKASMPRNLVSCADYDYLYDSYGNTDQVTLPPNAAGQRMYYHYEYDTVLHSHVVKITDP